MCCFHWSIKKLFWVLDRAELRYAGKIKWNAGRKKAESERHHGSAARERCAETLLVGHDLVVIYRLTEMG